MGEAKMKKEEDRKRKKKGEAMKKRMRAAMLALPKHLQDRKHTENAIKASVAEYREITRKSELKWEKDLKRIKQSARQGPLLMETDNRAERKIQARRKALLAIKEGFIKAGVKDLSRFFDKQELEDLQL